MADPKEGHPPPPAATSSLPRSSADTAASSSSSSLSELGLEPITLVKTRSVTSSHAVVDPDPLAPLEEALASPDQETQYERLARQVSATSSPHPGPQGQQQQQHGDNNNNNNPLSRAHTGATSIASRPPDFEVTFGGGDAEGPASPRNWPLWRRAWVVFCVSFSSWVIVLYSTSYTASIPGLMRAYGVEDESVVTLGVTTYLLGLAAGSLVVAPMSELYGRRPVYLICLACFTLLVLPTAKATSLGEILAVRFVGACFGAAMVSNGPGTIVDISTDEYRALYMSLWSIAPLNGPVTGPLIGGFVYQYLGWRWDNWLVMILGGAAVLLMATVPETYGPAILQREAKRRRKALDDERWWSRYDQRISTYELLKLNLSRPFMLSLTEPILWCFNIWISVIYGILYLCFVAYPIVFTQHRGWSPGISGLSFVGIGVGTMIAILAEPLWRRMINGQAKDPATGRVRPEATALVMFVGAVLTPVGQLAFSWTCLPTSIHWAVPIAFGIPFGAGNTLCFIYGTNYIAGAYGMHAASALAGNALVRSLFGGTLPLAGPAMYARLTPQWAGTLLGLMEVALIPIPFAFFRYGDRIRAKSRVIRQMREDQERMESKRARREARTEAAAARAQETNEEIGDKTAVAADAASVDEEDGTTTIERDVEKDAIGQAPQA